MTGGREHWDEVYRTKAEDAVSWFQAESQQSLALIAKAALPKSAAIIDVGGGRSRLAAALLASGYDDVTVLDVSAAALETQAAAAQRLVADITTWEPARRYDVWHDRAVLHFFVDEAPRTAYLRALRAATKPGANVFIATFASSGPERCSGLPVRRYDAAALTVFLGGDFELRESAEYDHLTPWGATQRFHSAWLQRR